MNIAYYAERSIEDEITRESVGDISTILVSYVMMFAYITLALGNLSSSTRRMLVSGAINLGLYSNICD